MASGETPHGVTMLRVFATAACAATISGKRDTMTTDVPLTPKKPETMSEVVATYCLAPIS